MFTGSIYFLLQEVLHSRTWQKSCWSGGGQCTAAQDFYTMSCLISFRIKSILVKVKERLQERLDYYYISPKSGSRYVECLNLIKLLITLYDSSIVRITVKVSVSECFTDSLCRTCILEMAGCCPALTFSLVTVCAVQPEARINQIYTAG